MNNYVNGYLNYTGNKFKLLEQILPKFDYNKKQFVDLFAGSMVVSANILDKYDGIYVNDIIKNLIGIHKSVIESDNIIDEVKILATTKDDQEKYSKLRDDYNLNPTPAKLFALILSCNSNFMRFNNDFKFNQTWGKRGFNDNTEIKINNFIQHVRPYKDKINFLSEHFNNVIIPFSSMVYIDYPYGFYRVGNNLSNKQISEAGYNCYWKQNDEKLLYDYINNINKSGNSFMLSGVLEHDDKTAWLTSELIKDGFKYEELMCDYNKVSKKGDKITKEVIIYNY